MFALPGSAIADPLRVAFFNSELSRDGPGILLSDLQKGSAPDLAATLAVIASADADILVLSGVDFDLGLVALSVLRDAIAADGPHYAHVFTLPPNTGRPTDHDLNGDGRRRGPRDAQGYGAFAGQGGLALLSRHPIIQATDFSAVLWRDIPGSLSDPSDPGRQDARLSSNAHWSVDLVVPALGRVTILTYHATPPVFDGPEDRNGRRNHDETMFWLHHLDGRFGPPPPDRFVILGDANLDPIDGDGRPTAIRALLADPRLQDAAPRSDTGLKNAGEDGGVNQQQDGDPTLDTANWDDAPGGPGNLRVDYVLPSQDWAVTGSGIVWGSGDKGVLPRPRHGLVWADLVPGR